MDVKASEISENAARLRVIPWSGISISTESPIATDRQLVPTGISYLNPICHHSIGSVQFPIAQFAMTMHILTRTLWKPPGLCGMLSPCIKI